MPLANDPGPSRTEWLGSAVLGWLCSRPLALRVVPRPRSGICNALGSSASVGEDPGSPSGSLSLLLPPIDRSQDSTAVALSDSSSTQDFFNEPTSSLEGPRKSSMEKKLPTLSSQPAATGKDLHGPTEERGMKTQPAESALLCCPVAAQAELKTTGSGVASNLVPPPAAPRLRPQLGKLLTPLTLPRSPCRMGVIPVPTPGL